MSMVLFLTCTHFHAHYNAKSYTCRVTINVLAEIHTQYHHVTKTVDRQVERCTDGLSALYNYNYVTQCLCKYINLIIKSAIL